MQLESHDGIGELEVNMDHLEYKVTFDNIKAHP
jgi:hypothetical protein